MNYKHTLRRSQRIKMFLYEYYFGQTNLQTLMRIIGGPLLIFFGIDFFQRNDKFAVAYGGFMFVYGIYYLLKPLFWITFRFDSFKTTNFNIDIFEDRLVIIDPTAKSEIAFDSLNKVLNRKFYYALEVNKHNKIYLPTSILQQEQIDILKQKSIKKNTR